MDATDVDTIDDMIDRLHGRDSLADTPFSKLFHEARTSTPDTVRRNGYTGVSAQIRVRDGEIDVSKPVKTRQGEHLRGTDAYDGMVHLHVQPFMEVSTARREIMRQLRAWKRNHIAKREAEDWKRDHDPRCEAEQ
jgi:hypothetical protein